MLTSGHKSGLFILATLALFASPARAAEKATGSATPTDAQIFGILASANNGEIEAAQLAKTKSTNADVKKFADSMITDHTKLNDDGKALASKLAITPEESPQSEKLKAASATEMKKLEPLTGAAFDKAYVKSQVKDHEQVLHMFDSTLIPSAKNPELRTMLHTARPIIASHLKHAKQLQSTIAKSGATTTDNP